MDTISTGPAPVSQLNASEGALLTRLARFGKVYLFPAVTSTNDVARKLAAEGLPALVAAETQTRGRGRFSREWLSPAGGLWFSMLFFPDIAPERAGLITLAAGLATAEAIERLAGLKPDILWPNDVYVGTKKVCGILCEGKGRAVIAGIGLNLNQASFPTELPDASSLFLLTGKSPGRFEMMLAICEEFRNRLDELKEASTLPLIGELKSRMSMLGHPVTIETSRVGLGSLVPREVSGAALDLNENGELLVQTQDGAVRTFSAGKVIRVR
jgi:BirA family biotin operon repressor/biotin-[acetyl-CoA-carboxylase] ligase